jgi:methylmalonyl-CoA carboxyltransferase 12S subunit
MANTVKTKDLLVILEQVQAQLAKLTDRVAQLESGVVAKTQPEVEIPAPAVVEEPAAVKEPAAPEITEEEILAITAALGAYLGVRIRLKQIRLLSSPAWAQQGRVSIQASHNLHI